MENYSLICGTKITLKYKFILKSLIALCSRGIKCNCFTYLSATFIESYFSQIAQFETARKQIYNDEDNGGLFECIFVEA